MSLSWALPGGGGDAGSLGCLSRGSRDSVWATVPLWTLTKAARAQPGAVPLSPPLDEEALVPEPKGRPRGRHHRMGGWKGKTLAPSPVCASTTSTTTPPPPFVPSPPVLQNKGKSMKMMEATPSGALTRALGVVCAPP